MTSEIDPRFIPIPPSTQQAVRQANRDREQQRVREAKDRVARDSELRKDIEEVLHMNPSWSRRRARRLVERNMRKRAGER